MLKLKPFGFIVVGVLSTACSDNKAIKQDLNIGSSTDKVIYHKTLKGETDIYLKQQNKGAKILTNSVLKIEPGHGKLTQLTSDTDKTLHLSYQKSDSLNLYTQSKPALNLSRYYSAGVLALDVKFEKIKKASIEIGVSCVHACRSKIKLRDWAQDRDGKAWQPLYIPLNCLVESADALNQVKTPFHLITRGSGDIELRNIRYTNNQDANFDCITADKRSVTASMLNEFWSVSWWAKRHQQKLDEAQQSDPDLILIGDSITHGWENTGKSVWKTHFSDINSLNLGFSGDRTENVIWRLQHGEVDNLTPELTVIMIGTNNTGHRLDKPEYIKNGVAKIVELLKQKIPHSPILLLAIFPRSAQPNDVERQNNEITNQLLKNLANQQGILFANFNDAFLDENEVLSTTIMPDLLHPNKQGYEIWAQQLKPYISQYVKNK
ncbi:GDSL-type esterase/lipase family protein [Catenovulum adriaticum]|uniref:GDSL-type esterase/lipase family protein n=1 Tax=Catenovulum adriaticum TaxID=2984846 RepID=A0ABY7ASB7_9ALTE|nr:GDSL-type esterase/lipase family protein [Catenovulum sp. TS8]WAJ72423.1 GDSL-type esterase/lipase family protein [Catenovulum sp. TS8]